MLIQINSRTRTLTRQSQADDRTARQRRRPRRDNTVSFAVLLMP